MKEHSTKLLIILCLALLATIIILISCPIKQPAIDYTPVVTKYEQLINTQEKAHKKAIDSLTKQEEVLQAENIQLEKEISRLKRKKNLQVTTYHQKKVDDRAQAFLESTQSTPVQTPVFSNDSLIVPMRNVDSAMTLIIEERFADSVISLKDQEIDNYSNQVHLLSGAINEYKGLLTLQEEKFQLMEYKYTQSEAYSKKLERKQKWLKIKGTVKDIVIVAGIGYLIFL